MPRYIIERQYLMPVYQHLAVEAPDFETACRKAMDEAKYGWEGAIDDPEGARPHHLVKAVEVPDDATWVEAVQASRRPISSTTAACRCWRSPAKFSNRKKQRPSNLRR